MAIDKDIAHRTAISVNHTRIGNVLHRRERHAVKDSDDVLHITHDETSTFQGQEALKYLDDLKRGHDNLDNSLATITASNDAQEAELASDVQFLADQIAEIEALLT